MKGVEGGEVSGKRAGGGGGGWASQRQALPAIRTQKVLL